LLTVPPGMSAQVQIPADKNSKGVFLGGKPVAAHRDGQWWVLDQDVTGEVSIEARKL
jgi:alpha-L-rhamnosidase